MNSFLRPSRVLSAFQIFFFSLLFASPWALADAVGRGAGVVRDGSGPVVPGAKVTLTRTSTNAVLTRTTDASGAFQFLELPPHTYTLSIHAPVFKRPPLSPLAIHLHPPSPLAALLHLY